MEEAETPHVAEAVEILSSQDVVMVSESTAIAAHDPPAGPPEEAKPPGPEPPAVPLQEAKPPGSEPPAMPPQEAQPPGPKPGRAHEAGWVDPVKHVWVWAEEGILREAPLICGEFGFACAVVNNSTILTEHPNALLSAVPVMKRPSGAMIKRPSAVLKRPSGPIIEEPPFAEETTERSPPCARSQAQVT